MSYKSDIEIKDNYIFLKAVGSYSGIDDLPESMKVLVDVAAKNNIHKVILDFSNVKGQFTAADKYELGELAAKIWGVKLQVAFIYRAGEISGMFENVAVNRGGNLRVFTNIEEAKEWLEKTSINV